VLNEENIVKHSRFAAMLLLSFLALNSSLIAFQGSELSQGAEHEMLPTNSGTKAEWVFARFNYMGGAGRGRWSADYPKSDRQFVLGVHRLTRLDTRAVEQVIDANNDDLYDWPWIFVEDAGEWRLSQRKAQRLREYLLRGGFLVLDDSHGDEEWSRLATGLSMIFPDRQIEDVPEQDEIFHILYDLNNRPQVPGTRFLWGYRRYSADMREPKWRAVRDDDGRIMVAIWHNTDVGDAWEWADNPKYPETATSLAYRLGINNIIYGMTH
jgi:hypothetical protein